MDSNYGRGGVTSNEDVLRNFCTNTNEVKANNLSTHYDSNSDELLLRQYGVLIAKRKGDKLMITSKRYSVTTSKVQNELLRIAMEYGLDVQKTNEFAKGGNVRSKGEKLISETSHYKVRDNIFVDYMDAMDYCDNVGISYDEIVKTKEYAKGGEVEYQKLTGSLKSKLKSANNILKRYGGREITEHEAIMWNIYHNATSGFEAGFEAFDVAGAKNYHNATKREIHAIGDNLIDISRAMTGVDYDDYNFRGTKVENDNYYLENYKNKKYANGGDIAQGNYEMMLSQAKEVEHHVEELQNILKGEKDIDAWVVAKMENVSSTLSDITHYLDGKTEYAYGGKMSRGGLTVFNVIDFVKASLEEDYDYTKENAENTVDYFHWHIQKMYDNGKSVSEITDEITRLDAERDIDKEEYYKENDYDEDYDEYEYEEYEKGGNVRNWSVSNIGDAKHLGVIEFQDNEGEYHNFEVMETDERLVFGGFTNSGFIESGYIEKDGMSTDETLQNLLEDLEVYYNDGQEYTSMIVFNERMAKGGMIGGYSVVLEADDIKNSSFQNYLKRNGIKHKILSVQYNTAQVKFIGSKEALTKMIDKFWVDIEESEMQELYDSIQKNEYAKGGNIKSKTNKKMATKKVKDGQAAPQTKRWIFAFNKGGYNYYNTKEVPYKKPVDSEKKGAPVGYRFSKFAEEKGITNNRFRKPTKSEVEQYAGKKKNGKLIMYRETRSNKSDVNPKKRI